MLKVIVSQIEDIQTGIDELETQVLAWHKRNPVSQRLATIPGIGPVRELLSGAASVGPFSLSLMSLSLVVDCSPQSAFPPKDAARLTLVRQ